MRSFKVGIIAPKHSKAETIRYLIPHLMADAEPYARGGDYDVVYFFNLTPEIRLVKRHTGAKVVAVGCEPPAKWSANYDASLVNLCDLYIGYQRPLQPSFRGSYRRFSYPAATRLEIEENFDKNILCKRVYDFSIFARHDPNIRSEIGNRIREKNGLLCGDLFHHSVVDKKKWQTQARYEFITENEINDFYFSEKLGQALLAGCVPIYYGCTKINEFFDDSMFIDFRDFNDLNSVIDYCLKPGTYEMYFDNIRDRARGLLLEKHSWETNITDVINVWVAELANDGAKRIPSSLYWRFQRSKNRWLHNNRL